MSNGTANVAVKRSENANDKNCWAASETFVSDYCVTNYEVSKDCYSDN